MTRSEHTYDIVIVGSGIVGATAALVLAKNTSLHIAVLEAKTPTFNEQSHSHETRVSAIALSSQRIFENIHVWPSIASKRISPYQKMHVWDPLGKGEIFFTAETLQEKALGYIIEDHVMRESLLEQFTHYNNLDFLCPVTPSSLEKVGTDIVLTTTDQQIIQTKLLIAADGAESWVRKQLGVELTTRDYQHTAIIASVQTELPHQATARQSFLSTGPLALLPLEHQNQCSIVWSVMPDYAAELLALNDDAFNKALSSAFEYRLGHITVMIPRQSFSLKMRHAKHYVGEGYALIGDAAHTIHPLAGQGVNLGLLDAAALTDVISVAWKKNRNFASHDTLRRYERWRKGDTLTMLRMVDALKYVFSSEKKALFYLRNAGLNMVDRLSFMKAVIANYALGKRANLPDIAL
jgi:2-octaprenylphenol hydroxylase